MLTMRHALRGHFGEIPYLIITFYQGVLALSAVKHLLSLGADANATWEEQAFATDDKAHALWKPWLTQRTVSRLELAMGNITSPDWREIERHGPCGGSLFNVLHMAVRCNPFLPADPALYGPTPAACSASRFRAVQLDVLPALTVEVVI
jgi:hypothetical protein